MALSGPTVTFYALGARTPDIVSRIRIYVDPYESGRKAPLWSLNYSDDLPDEVFQLFQHLADNSWSWFDSEDKIWDHWTSAYVDYFGPRSFELSKSHFYAQSAKRIVKG